MISRGPAERRRLRIRAGAFFAVGLAWIGGCETTPPAPTTEATGVVEWAVGSERGRLGWDAFDCRRGPNETVTWVWHSSAHAIGPQGVSHKPPALVVVSRGVSVVEATTYLPNVALAGQEYPMLTLTIASADGEPACRLEEAAGERRLSCNGARPVPWLASGPRPTGGFSASVPACP